MSKRKNRTPNLPKATVERAREQAAQNEGSTEERSEERAARRAERRAEREKVSANSRRGLQPAVPAASRKKENLANSTYLREALAKPTKFVSEEQLHEEYGYVLADVRNMFALAAALMVLMAILAQFI